MDEKCGSQLAGSVSFGNFFTACAWIMLMCLYLSGRKFMDSHKPPLLSLGHSQCAAQSVAFTG